jgi:hypothetical protein
MFIVHVRSVPGRSGDGFLDKGQIIRMATIEDQCLRGCHRLWVFQEAVTLVRPNDFSAGNLPPQAAGVRHFLGLSQECLAPAQFPLRLFAFGDVAQVTRKGRRPVHRDACNREFDGEFAPVGPYCSHLDVLSEESRLTCGQETGKTPPVLLPERLWNDDVGHLPAHDLIPTVAEGALRGRIELSDATFVINRHNAVEGRFQDRCLARLASL